jgi:hypothetical protein
VSGQERTEFDPAMVTSLRQLLKSKGISLVAPRRSAARKTQFKTYKGSRSELSQRFPVGNG